MMAVGGKLVLKVRSSIAQHALNRIEVVMAWHGIAVERTKLDSSSRRVASFVVL